ncbi:hypothetical protein QBC36DRAFT_338580 [Triangularia setosa]|uniref:Uncharacterized protein n=1 Tax=Triangularia setosa TaxID=2587417 RepID=A0AAN6VYI4_9PEZI|nr:hypothetical protein QBC36DRAFT_338580 [Podospora setosa]
MSFLTCDHSCFINENSKTPFSLVYGKPDEDVGVYTEFRTMKFLTSLYINTRFREFRDGFTTAITRNHRLQIEAACIRPSSTERLRVLGEFYRQQFLCNVWAPTE